MEVGRAITGQFCFLLISTCPVLLCRIVDAYIANHVQSIRRYTRSNEYTHCIRTNIIRTDKRTDKPRNGRTDNRRNVQTDKQTNERTDGRTNGQTYGRMFGRTDERTGRKGLTFHTKRRIYFITFIPEIETINFNISFVGVCIWNLTFLDELKQHLNPSKTKLVD